MASPPNRPLENSPAAGVGPQDLRAWMVQYGPALRRYFMKRASVAEAEDLVQDVFLSMQARGGGAQIDNVEGYLFRTAATVLVDEHRYDTLGLRQHAALSEDLEPIDDFSPERILIGQENLDQIMAAVHALPPRVSEAFIFHRFEEMTYPEIARRLGVSVSAVKQLVARAIRQVSEDRRQGS